MTTNKTKQLTAQQLAIKLQKMNCTIQNHVSRGGGFASARWVGFSVRLEEMKDSQHRSVWIEACDILGFHADVNVGDMAC